MNTIDVGVLRAAEITFTLYGGYRLNDDVISGTHTVLLDDGKLRFQNEEYDVIQFTPMNEKARFLLHNVEIGLSFHWQRKENQLFAGELHIIGFQSGLQAINRIDVETYLVSVISSEMSASSSLELLKAHAVISRSWLYAQLLRLRNATDDIVATKRETTDEVVRWYAREDHKFFDFCADDHCQRYQGLTRAINPNVQKAVEETSGMVLMHESRVCDARFSKCCGGVTELFSSCWEDEDVPYLQSLQDSVNPSADFNLTSEEDFSAWLLNGDNSFCNTNDKALLSQILNVYDFETTDFYRWKAEYSQSQLSKLVNEKSGIDFGTVKELIPMQRGLSGRIIRLKIVGSRCTKIIGKELEIRRILSTNHLRSSAFIVQKRCTGELETSTFTFLGAGWGHGVGLCQIGAAVMGSRGYGFSQILSHYYPQTTLRPINPLQVLTQI